MGECNTSIKEVRFVFEDELTYVYVHCEAWGDCPLGVQGWHHKTFPVSRTAIDILRNDISGYVLWPQQAPPGLPMG